MRELRLLLVEDSADDAELIARILRRSGFSLTCHRVETAQAMEEALARHGWDLVIADYSLPSFDGLAALRLLRERAPDLPFILVSASVGEDTAVEAMKAGANDYVLKHNLARLRPAIERELAEARRQQLSMVPDEVLHKSAVKRTDLLPISATRLDKDLFVITRPPSPNPGSVIWFAGEEVERFVTFDEFFLAMVEYSRRDVEWLRRRRGID